MASLSTSGGGSFTLPRVASKRGPISSKCTFGNRVPLFLYLMANCRNKMVFPSSKAVMTIARSMPFKFILETTRPRNTSANTFFNCLKFASVSNLSPRNIMHGFEPIVVEAAALPNLIIGTNVSPFTIISTQS